MNREEIVRMAKEAGMESFDICVELDDFAALVASAEREACADIAENWRCNGMPRTGVANEIRARGRA